MSSPEKLSSPGQSGVNGRPLYPVATITSRVCDRAGLGVEAPRVSVALDPRDESCSHREPLGVGVLAGIVENAVARDPAAVPAWNPPTRQAGEESRRVQAQPVVAFAPRGSRLGAGLEDERLDARAAK